MIKQIAKRFIRSDGNLNSAQYKKSKVKHPRIIKLIETTTIYLKDVTFAERLFYIINNYTTTQICENPTCTNPKPFKSLNTGLQNFCSIKCSHNTDDYKKKFKDIWADKSEDELQEISSKRVKSNLEKYGVESTNQLERVKEKKKETWIKNLNVSSPMKSLKVKQKRKENNNLKYGNDFPNQNHINDFERLFNKEFIESNFIKSGFFQLEDFCKYYNVGYTTSLRVRNILNINAKVKKKYFQSQSEVFDNILQLDERALFNSKKLGKEIDIISEKYKIGIEYDGLIWHSYGKSKTSFLNNYNDENNAEPLQRSLLCKEHNLLFLNIFENEWKQKEEIWKSVILSKTNNTKRIFARNCYVKNIDSKTSKKFLTENHLQGNINAGVRLGLYLGDELLSVMTFGKSRFSKQYQWELLRFATKLNTTVVGGASKLLSFFEKDQKPESIVTYANKRWSNGNLYEKLNFTYSHDSKPNYFYFKSNSLILESRNKYQKHKLKNILEFFDENLSETENMYNNGYRKIYDLGNKVYFKIY